MRPLNAVPPRPTAARRVSVPASVHNVQCLARFSFLVGFTQRRPLRRPGRAPSILIVIFAASDSRQASRAPRWARAAVGVAFAATAKRAGAILTWSRTGGVV